MHAQLVEKVLTHTYLFNMQRCALPHHLLFWTWQFGLLIYVGKRHMGTFYLAARWKGQYFGRSGDHFPLTLSRRWMQWLIKKEDVWLMYPLLADPMISIKVEKMITSRRWRRRSLKIEKIPQIRSINVRFPMVGTKYRWCCRMYLTTIWWMYLDNMSPHITRWSRCTNFTQFCGLVLR